MLNVNLKSCKRTFFKLFFLSSIKIFHILRVIIKISERDVQTNKTLKLPDP